jgi:hypothetical protein
MDEHADQGANTMTYITQPDLLPVPDDGSTLALALPAFRALADAVQAALTAHGTAQGGHARTAASGVPVRVPFPRPFRSPPAVTATILAPSWTAGAEVRVGNIDAGSFDLHVNDATTGDYLAVDVSWTAVGS